MRGTLGFLASGLLLLSVGLGGRMPAAQAARSPVSGALHRQLQGAPATPCVVQTPDLVSPENKAVVRTKKVLLEWQADPCATSYVLQVKRDSKQGPALLGVLLDGHTAYTLRGLRRGHTYLWRLKACNESGCSWWSPWDKFEVEAAKP